MSKLNYPDIKPPVDIDVRAQTALASVLAALEPLVPDDRKRVLHAATAFYRVEQK